MRFGMAGFPQNGIGASVELSELFGRDFVDEGFGFVPAGFFDVRRDGVWHVVSGRSRARGEAEEVYVIETRGLDEIDRFLPVFFRFAGEADDEVCRNADFGDVGAQVVKEREIGGDRGSASHGGQDGVAAALDGDVEVRAETGFVAPQAPEIFAHVPGFDGAQADAFDGGLGEDGADEVGKSEVVFFPGAQLHAGEHELVTAA